MPINSYMTITVTFFEAGYSNLITITILKNFILQELELIVFWPRRYPLQQLLRKSGPKVKLDGVHDY